MNFLYRYKKTHTNKSNITQNIKSKIETVDTTKKPPTSSLKAAKKPPGPNLPSTTAYGLEPLCQHLPRSIGSQPVTSRKPPKPSLFLHSLPSMLP